MTRFLTLLFLLLYASQAYADAISMTFEGVGNKKSVASFYDGVVFESQAAAYTHDDDNVHFANEPSSQTIVYSNSAFNMTKASGFTDTLSFYYSNNQTATVTIFDAANNELTSQTITPTDNGAIPDSWKHVIIPFDGVATRVLFGGDTLYDNINLGAFDVPMLSSLFKLLLALLFTFTSIGYLNRKHG